MKTIVFVGTSLDGFIAKADGNIEWLVPFENEDVHKAYAEFLSKIDAIVMGRGTFETVMAHPSWPYQKKVFVLSTSIKTLPDTLQSKVTVLSKSPRELLSYLSGQGFSNIYVGGGKVIQSFLKEDCIDEMVITRVPVLIGNGIPLFGGLPGDLQFEHIRTDVYSNGLVSSRYRRKRFNTAIDTM